MMIRLCKECLCCFSYGTISRNGTLLDYTDEFGNFQLEFPFGTERVTLRIVDEFGETFQPKTHTVTFTTGQSGIVVETILLTELPVPVVIDTTEENVLDVASGEGDEIAAVILPPNSIYDADGNLFEVLLPITYAIQYFIPCTCTCVH